MTIPPKARLFRIRRNESFGSQLKSGASRPASTERAEAPPGTGRNIRIEIQRPASAGDDQKHLEPARPQAPFSTGSQDDGFGNRRFPGAASAESPPPTGEAPPETSQPGHGKGADHMAQRVEAVRAENLTGRQLRMARRIAAMHDINADSGHEAVILLRERGIDPFHRGEVGKILSTEGIKSQGGGVVQPSGHSVPAQLPGSNIPARIPAPGMPGRPAPPSRETLTEERRAAEILRIQRDIARRRRRRLLMLAARLLVLVGIPTLIAGMYFFKYATPLYATNSQFLIQQADSSPAGGLGGLFSGTQLATNPDSVSVQSYLTSRDAMQRLDRDHGFKQAFQDPAIDALLRLPSDATNEQTYKVYRNSVKIGYDPTEGVINMEVIAPNPELSEKFSNALIEYAEGQVDQMTARLRDDQMQGSIESYQDAERQVLAAQQRVLELQERLGVLDPVAEGSVIMNQIADLERQLNEKRLELGQLESNPTPNASRVAGVRGDIERIEAMLVSTRGRLTEGSVARGSLAAISGRIRIAESDLATRQELLAAAAAQMETARIEANKQVRYLSLSVAPVPPDEPTYPKAFQNTIVAFLIFSGIYLMLSLTASILREQVSS